MVSNGPAQRWVPLFERIDNGTLGGGLTHKHLDLTLTPCQGAQVVWKHNPDLAHGKVCTSTETTDGRSCTIVCHVSPLSGET